MLHPPRHKSSPDTILFWLASLLCLGSLLALSSLFTGCQTGPKAQKGGSTRQALSAPAAPAPPAPAGAPEQTLLQPENPEGSSLQELRKTTTSTAPSGEVVTTIEVARTQLGGSQSLAEIAREYAGSEYFQRIALALVLGALAYAVRTEWPSLQWVFGLGALAVAFFGLGAVLAVGGLGGGIVLAYYIVRSQSRGVIA